MNSAMVWLTNGTLMLSRVTLIFQAIIIYDSQFYTTPLARKGALETSTKQTGISLGNYYREQ